MMTLGVPPMRSSVQNEKPRSLPDSRAWQMSTQLWACLEMSPASNDNGPSAQRSAISAISASVSAVQSLVSIWIAITLTSPLAASWVRP